MFVHFVAASIDLFAEKEWKKSSGTKDLAIFLVCESFIALFYYLALPMLLEA